MTWRRDGGSSTRGSFTLVIGPDEVSVIGLLRDPDFYCDRGDRGAVGPDEWTARPSKESFAQGPGVLSPSKLYLFSFDVKNTRTLLISWAKRKG